MWWSTVNVYQNGRKYQKVSGTTEKTFKKLTDDDFFSQLQLHYPLLTQSNLTIRGKARSTGQPDNPIWITSLPWTWPLIIYITHPRTPDSPPSPPPTSQKMPWQWTEGEFTLLIASQKVIVWSKKHTKVYSGSNNYLIPCWFCCCYSGFFCDFLSLNVKMYLWLKLCTVPFFVSGQTYKIS